ncbi:peptidoglycan editing factor PgeF [Hyphomicrobium sp. 802]|uniref:peptidoglycan editing factor PgeF n=1 Tax=unclassified Hyphomicrobium TaxID=2619925 RepID=UPI00045E7797|nr:peptidoglycan editing factor PgeF [Hyphomicrobium sp. 802]
MSLKPIEARNLSSWNGIRHGFFTREGGVSTGLYASLNCGWGSSDDQNLVAENRNRIGRFLGGDEKLGGGVVTLYQEHGTMALHVTKAPDRAALPHADAVVSNTPGLVIGVLTADCAPVLMADAEAGVIAAAHAGWRGAINDVVGSAVAEMERLGAKRERITAAVGPCISQSAYEVGPEFEATFLERDPAFSTYFTRANPNARPHFDLPAFVTMRLQAAGVGSIEDLALCTCKNESLFFSYRRKTLLGEVDYGRQISAIVVA